MSPEEMMKPKNDCQRGRETEGDTKRKDGGMERKTDCWGASEERLEGRGKEEGNTHTRE